MPHPCSICHEHGHYAPTCPQRRVQKKRNQLGDKKIEESESVEFCPVRAAQITLMQNVLVMLQSSNGDHPTYTLKITKKKKNLENFAVQVRFGTTPRRILMVLDILPKKSAENGDVREGFAYDIQGNFNLFVNKIDDDEILAMYMVMKFEKLLELAGRLKFSKLLGVFYDKDIKLNAAQIAIEELSSLAGLCEYEQCCVCQDETKTKTLCGHTLCYECWDSLVAPSKCPLCRACIMSRTIEKEVEWDDE
jgi:hypothetical protein